MEINDNLPLSEYEIEELEHICMRLRILNRFDRFDGIDSSPFTLGIAIMVIGNIIKRRKKKEE